MIPTLELEDKDNKTVKFDEYLGNGKWKPSGFNYRDEKLVKLKNAYDNDYEYFIAEDSKGYHSLLRNKEQ